VEGYRLEANPPKKFGAVRTDIITDADLFSGDAFWIQHTILLIWFTKIFYKSKHLQQDNENETTA